MKKFSFVGIFMLICTAAMAQWSVSGNVSDANAQPVAGKTVYVSTDTMVLNSPLFIGSDVTDANGNYNVYFATGTPDPQQIVNVSVQDCNFMTLNDTAMYNVPQITRNFTLCVPAPVATDIHGVVSANAVAQDDAQVYLIAMSIDSNLNDTTLTAIDSTFTDAQGYYSLSLPNVWANHYMVKAALLPANANYSGYLPTYYTSSIMWSGATYLSNPFPLTAVDVDLIAGTNPGGPAFIGGNVSQGANKSTAVGDPLEHRILILTNMSNQPVAYTYSDATGSFSFSNLPLGMYKLFGDVMGKQNPALMVTLDATHQSVTNIEFQEHSQEFEGHFVAVTVGNVPAALQNASVFPNPATDKISIAGLSNVTGKRNVTLTAMTGSVVYTQDFTEKEAITVPVASLSKGIYMLQINTAEGHAIFKIVK